MKVFEVNAETGEEIVRDASAQELAQHQKDQAEFEKRKQEETANKAKRETALAKLANLGLTPDDLTALGL